MDLVRGGTLRRDGDLAQSHARHPEGERSLSCLVTHDVSQLEFFTYINLIATN